MYTRTSPLHSRIKERSLLTGPSSSKKTYHVVLDIEGADLPFKVGDSVGTLPMNDPSEVDQILKAIHAKGTETVLDSRAGNASTSIRDYLLFKANLSRVNSAFLKLLLAKGAAKELFQHLLAPENKAQLADFLHHHTLLDLLRHPLIETLKPAELAAAAMPLMPRFYSIANSLKVYPGEIHLLVAYVEYEIHGAKRRGVGSHFLCDLAEIDKTPVPIYVQPSNHFTLPAPDASMILVGPGTGVAPYRAFLQERLAVQSTGRNWLFFGERNRASDFYYADFWLELEKQERIRLDLAFSRDQKEKIYVQHKMYEQRKSIWTWISDGAYFFLCGDANEMAKDVEAMLQRIVSEEGHMSDEDARLYIKKMRADKRFLADVY